MAHPIRRTLGLLAAALGLAAAGLSCSDSGQPAAPGAATPAAAPAAVTTKSGIPMVALPGGWFVMGSGAGREKDEPPHRVRVSPFLIDRHEVTQDDFARLLGRNPSRWKEGRCPVEQIRWKDAAEFCNARSRLEGLAPAYDPRTWACDFGSGGYRLPTEAEWEYACRAGSPAEYAGGDAPARLAEAAWFKDARVRRPQPVGLKAPNAWGLYDMHGNVWEWCNDFYAKDYYRESPPEDPRGPATGETRVVRGGCWNSRAPMCRAAYRGDEDPGYTDACFAPDVSGFLGFRCAKSAP